MNGQKWLLTIILFGVLSACDPLKSLVVETSGRKNVSIVIYANRQFPSYFDKNTGKFVIRVPDLNDPTKNETVFDFSVGTWETIESRTSLANGIDSIVFNYPVKRKVLKNKKDMEAYFSRHRRGFFKQTLIIRAR